MSLNVIEILEAKSPLKLHGGAPLRELGLALSKNRQTLQLVIEVGNRAQRRVAKARLVKIQKHQGVTNEPV